MKFKNVKKSARWKNKKKESSEKKLKKNKKKVTYKFCKLIEFFNF